MTRRAYLLLPLVAMLLATACGESVQRERRTSTAPTDDAPESTQHDERRPSSPARPPCPAPGPILRPAMDPGEARTRLDRAVARATRTGGTFVTSLELHAGTLHAGTLRAGATMRGRAGATSSTARLAWTGGAAVLLPDATLRIAGDRIQVRTDDDRHMRDVGSASGVALDVGRELLAHPFLLDATSARGTPERFELRLRAPADRLRAYATTERRGPVTELLRGVRSLELVARVVDGRLRLDRFSLRTRVPRGVQPLAPLAGRDVTLVGVTRRC